MRRAQWLRGRAFVMGAMSMRRAQWLRGRGFVMGAM